TMPELPEVHRAERACNAKLVGKKIVCVESQEDNLVFCDMTNREFEKRLLNKVIVDTGRQGKYFYFIFNEGPHAVMHFGMTGDIRFKDQEIFQYRRPSKDDPKDWPPRFWKFTISLEELSDSSSQNIVMAFTDKRRLARIRLVNSPLQDPPISKLGFDPLQSMPDRQTFKEKTLKRHCPIKALLLDQSFSAGVGNWIADETLYQSRIHPAQYANTLSDEQITALYENLVYVCKTAVEVNADASLFPSSWLFHYRWGKGNKVGAFMPDGEKILFETVGGRTTAIVPSVQILIQSAKNNSSSNSSHTLTNLNIRKSTRQKRHTVEGENLQSENLTKHSYQQPQYISESQTNYEYMDYTPTPYDGHTTYTDVPYTYPNNSMTANIQQTFHDYITPQQQYLRQPLHQPMPQRQLPSEVSLQSMIPTQMLPQTCERHDLREQQLISQYPQQQEAQLLPHQLLWYFAEHYLSKATELPPTSLVNYPKLSSEQQKHILAAIKCLEAVIISVASSNTYTPLVELKTRFRLSQILFWFTENVREAENNDISEDSVADVKFRMIDLQCNIFKNANNIKAARNIMKSGAIEAMECNMPDWTYHFLLRHAELHNAEGDFNGCLSTLRQAESIADQRGDIEMKACLLITIVQYSLTNQNYSIAQHSLAELSTIYFLPPSSQPPQTYHIFPISNHRLRLHYLLLYVSFNMHTGNIKDATEKLTEIHNILNQERDVESLEDVKGYTTIHVSSAPTSTTSYSTSTAAAQSIPVKIKLLSKTEIYTLTFLISGICNGGNSANVVA
ncbi:9772_t:CDS:10, partial [Scutellospora calospora]